MTTNYDLPKINLGIDICGDKPGNIKSQLGFAKPQPIGSPWFKQSLIGIQSAGDAKSTGDAKSHDIAIPPKIQEIFGNPRLRSLLCEYCLAGANVFDRLGERHLFLCGACQCKILRLYPCPSCLGHMYLCPHGTLPEYGVCNLCAKKGRTTGKYPACDHCTIEAAVQACEDIADMRNTDLSETSQKERLHRSLKVLTKIERKEWLAISERLRSELQYARFWSETRLASFDDDLFTAFHRPDTPTTSTAPQKNARVFTTRRGLVVRKRARSRSPRRRHD